MIMNGKVYDTLKFISLLIIPLGTFISSLAKTWGWPCIDQINQTFIALDVLVGAFVVISNKVYLNQQEK